jgi:hypothetical protein
LHLIRAIRTRRDIKVVLWGFSGGGPTTTFYQAVAENGPSYCRGPRKLIECGDGLAGLPPADGLILVDAHPGNSVNGIRSLNAAVTNDAAIVNGDRRAQIDIVEGATHGQTPCVPCEGFPGQYSNTVRNFFDYVANWINERF